VKNCTQFLPMMSAAEAAIDPFGSEANRSRYGHPIGHVPQLRELGLGIDSFIARMRRSATYKETRQRTAVRLQLKFPFGEQREERDEGRKARRDMPAGWRSNGGAAFEVHPEQ
jgi:hypothetical protein